MMNLSVIGGAVRSCFSFSILTRLVDRKLPSVFQISSAFQVSTNQQGLIVATLDPSDLQENVTAYAVQISGEPRLVLVPFINTSEPLVFNASFHGLCYTLGLLVKLGQSWSRPTKSVPVLTSKGRTNNCARY